MLDQDTFINMLNMIYPTVSIISKKKGIYITHDESKNYLIINKDNISINEEIKTNHIGSSWISVTKLDNTLDIIDKNTGMVLKSYKDVTESSKQNIFNNKYSTLNIRDNKNFHTVRLIIIDNTIAKIIHDIKNVKMYTINKNDSLSFKIETENKDVIRYRLNKDLTIERDYGTTLFY